MVVSDSCCQITLSKDDRIMEKSDRPSLTTPYPQLNHLGTARQIPLLRQG